MKKFFSLTLTLFAAFAAFAQENVATLNGGYAFIAGDEVYANLSGWRINATYEYNPFEGPVSHGLAFGYAYASGPSTAPGQTNVNIEIGTWPIYYQPKYTFGSGNLQGFVSGALGWQFSNISRTGTLVNISDNNGGFYGGGGAGFQFKLSPTFFLKATYEVAWMSNYNYNDGWLNSAMGGIGFRF